MSAREMYLKSVRLGLSLQKAGVRSGDIVSIISQNSPVMTPLSVGLLAIGAIVSYLDENVVTYYSKLLLKRCDLTKWKSCWSVAFIHSTDILSFSYVLYLSR